MQQKQFIAIAFSALSLGIMSCGGSKHSSSTKTLPGTWQGQPITIDADSKDWPSPYPSYDAKALVGYATSNDKDHLYITLETGDEYVQMKILKQGLTVYIDTSGKKNETVAIHYPMQDPEPLEMPSRKEAAMNGDQSGMSGFSRNVSEKLKHGVANATQLSLEGFVTCNGGFLVTQENPCGIKVRVGIDEYKELIWEASIPLRAIYGRDQTTKAEAGKPISVCFAVKGFKHPSTNDNNSNNSGSGMGGRGMHGGGMGGGGMHGGGRGGGRGGNTADPREMLFESTHTWKTFGLAYEQ